MQHKIFNFQKCRTESEIYFVKCTVCTRNYALKIMWLILKFSIIVFANVEDLIFKKWFLG